MALKLVDCRWYAGMIQQVLQVMLLKVTDANGPGMPFAIVLLKYLQQAEHLHVVLPLAPPLNSV